MDKIEVGDLVRVKMGKFVGYTGRVLSISKKGALFLDILSLEKKTKIRQEYVVKL